MEEKAVTGQNVRIRIKKSKGGNFEAAEWRKARRFPDDDPNVWTITRGNLMGWIRFLVENTYVCNNGTIRRQTVGLPMGTNCAPLLANLYLYAYEARWIDRLCNHGEIVKARLAHMTFRLIDDVFSLDNASFEEYIRVNAPEDLDGPHTGGIYPRELKLNDTKVSDPEVMFVGMTIKDEDGELVMDVFDKRRSFPFEVIRYPHMESVIPSNVPYGVFVGLFTRYRICNRLGVFIVAATDVAEILFKKGCKALRLKRLFRDFLVKLQPLRWRTSIARICKQFCRRFKSGLGN